MNYDFNNIGSEDDYHDPWWNIDDVLWAVLAVSLCVLIGWLAAQGF